MESITWAAMGWQSSPAKTKVRWSGDGLHEVTKRCSCQGLNIAFKLSACGVMCMSLAPVQVLNDGALLRVIESVVRAGQC